MIFTLYELYSYCPEFDDPEDWDDGDIWGDWDDYDDWESGSDPLIPSIQQSSTLTSSQQAKLEEALQKLIREGCMQQALYDALVSNNVKLDFGMLPNAVNPATYNPYNKSIKFKENGSITAENLKEELFHAWQDAYYPGGTAQYGKDTQGNKLPGLVNIEFEAKFYRDIIEHPDGLCCNAFGENLPDNLYQEYYAWIESIRFSGSLSFSNSDYGKWLNYFQQYDKNYTSPMSDDLLTPKALRDLISNATCF